MRIPEGWKLVECSLWTEEQIGAGVKNLECVSKIPGVEPRTVVMCVADAMIGAAPDVQLSDFHPSASDLAGKVIPRYICEIPVLPDAITSEECAMVKASDFDAALAREAELDRDNTRLSKEIDDALDREAALREDLANHDSATLLINAWCAEHKSQISWDKAIEIIAAVTKMPDAEKTRLLCLDDQYELVQQRLSAAEQRNARLYHVGMELTGVIDEYRAMPCASLQDRMFRTADRYRKRLTAKCGNCEDHGVIGYTTGQTPETFDQGEYPCPECHPTEYAVWSKP